MKSCELAAASQQSSRAPARVTFIVRMWRDLDASEQLNWRGVVEHVQGSERRLVSDPDEMVELLTAWLSEDAE